MPWFVVWDSDNTDLEEATGLEAGSVEEAAELYMEKDHESGTPADEMPSMLQVIQDAGTPEERTHLVRVTTDWDPVFTAEVLDPAAELGKRVMTQIKSTGAMDAVLGRPATAELLAAARGIIMAAAQKMAARYQLRDLGIREVADLDKFVLVVSVNGERSLDVAWEARTWMAKREMDHETRARLAELRRRKRGVQSESERTRAAAQLQVDAWNASVAVGTKVRVTRDDGSHVETTTRSAAWVLCDHASVLVDGISGGYSLDRVVVWADLMGC